YVATTLLAVTVFSATRSSGTIVGERERGTWEPLYLTGLTAKAVIRDKFQGILWDCAPPVFAFNVGTFVGALVAGADSYWLVVLLFFPIHQFVLQRFMISVGLAISSEARTSWRSLLGTVSFGVIVGGMVALWSLMASTLATFCCIGV